MLHLDRDLPDTVSAYVRCNVQPKMASLQDAFNRADKGLASTMWTHLERLFDPRLPFLAACYDAVEWFLDHPHMAGVRNFVGRTIARPGATGTDVPLGDWLDPQSILGLTDRLRLRVRDGSWTIREGILALCSEGTFSTQVLADILDAEPRGVTKTCRALVKEGRLTSQQDSAGAAQFKGA